MHTPKQQKSICSEKLEKNLSRIYFNTTPKYIHINEVIFKRDVQNRSEMIWCKFIQWGESEGKTPFRRKNVDFIVNGKLQNWIDRILWIIENWNRCEQAEMFMMTFCWNNLIIKQSVFFSKAVQINTKFILIFLFINDCIGIHCYWKEMNGKARIFIVVKIQSKTDWFFWFE